LENGLIVFFPVEKWLDGFNNLRVQRNVEESHKERVCGNQVEPFLGTGQG